MTDLHTRFRTLDDLRTPDLWREIEGRALAVEPRPVRSLAWVLIVVMLLLTVAIGGAALIGSGILKLPVSVDASATPSSTPHESTSASSTPVEQRPPAWTATGNMDGVRSGHTATLLPDGKVLVTGGSIGYFSGELLASAELYDPGSGSWTATGSMAAARDGHTATLLPDGTVLVAGGVGSSGELASAELYDPRSGTWVPTGNMIETRFTHTATLLRDGTVLVAGGFSGGDSGSTLASAELFDPDSETWTAAGSMAEARDNPMATLLPDGTVLVAGGFHQEGCTPSTPCSGSIVPLASAELYDPRSGTE